MTANLFEGLTCIEVAFKRYTVEEVGQQAYDDGASSYLLSFEHDPSRTKQDGMIIMIVEIVSQAIEQYNGSFKMWDGESLMHHVGIARSKAQN